MQTLNLRLSFGEDHIEAAHGGIHDQSVGGRKTVHFTHHPPWIVVLERRSVDVLLDVLVEVSQFFHKSFVYQVSVCLDNSLSDLQWFTRLLLEDFECLIIVVLRVVALGQT